MLAAHPLVAICSIRTAGSVFMASIDFTLALRHRVGIFPTKDIKRPLQRGQAAVGDVKPTFVLAVVAKLIRNIAGKLSHFTHFNGIHGFGFCNLLLFVRPAETQQGFALAERVDPCEVGTINLPGFGFDRLAGCQGAEFAVFVPKVGIVIFTDFAKSHFAVWFRVDDGE